MNIHHISVWVIFHFTSYNRFFSDTCLWFSTLYEKWVLSINHIQSMLDKRTPDKRTHRISEPFFISQYQFPNFLHCKTNKHRISEPWISEPPRINEPFFISQRYPNPYFRFWISEPLRISEPFSVSPRGVRLSEVDCTFYQLRTQPWIQSIYMICVVDKIQIVVIVPKKFQIVENRKRSHDF